MSPSNLETLRQRRRVHSAPYSRVTLAHQQRGSVALDDSIVASAFRCSSSSSRYFLSTLRWCSVSRGTCCLINAFIESLRVHGDRLTTPLPKTHTWRTRRSTGRGRAHQRRNHIQNVNAHPSRLKQRLYRFHGVATGYQNNYLGWFRALDNHHAASGQTVLAMALGEFLHLTVR